MISPTPPTIGRVATAQPAPASKQANGDARRLKRRAPRIRAAHIHISDPMDFALNGIVGDNSYAHDFIRDEDKTPVIRKALEEAIFALADYCDQHGHAPASFRFNVVPGKPRLLKYKDEEVVYGEYDGALYIDPDLITKR